MAQHPRAQIVVEDAGVPLNLLEELGRELDLPVRDQVPDGAREAREVRVPRLVVDHPGVQLVHQRLDVREKPRLQVRILNHWDNLDGSIERGYGGRSLWKWDELPGTIDPRLHDYARANVSIGRCPLRSIGRPSTLWPRVSRRTSGDVCAFAMAACSRSAPYGAQVA